MTLEYRCPVCWEKGPLWYFKLKETLKEGQVYCPNCESTFVKGGLIKIGEIKNNGKYET